MSRPGFRSSHPKPALDWTNPGSLLGCAAAACLLGSLWRRGRIRENGSWRRLEITGASVTTRVGAPPGVPAKTAGSRRTAGAAIRRALHARAGACFDAGVIHPTFPSWLTYAACTTRFAVAFVPPGPRPGIGVPSTLAETRVSAEAAGETGSPLGNGWSITLPRLAGEAPARCPSGRASGGAIERGGGRGRPGRDPADGRRCR